MKTVTLSNRFYYRELDPADAQAIKNDLVLFNKMLHTAYKFLTLKFQGFPWDFESLQKKIKSLYNTNDYFPLSAIWKAKQVLKCNYAHHQKAVQQKKEQVQRIESKINEKQKEIEKIDKKLNKLIEKTKRGKQTQKDYLMEVQELRPKRKALKNQISQLKFRKNRVLQIMERPMSFQCFGGKKTARLRTTTDMTHEQWYQKYHHKRNHLISITGRRQGKYSNNLFNYHIDEGFLVYRCSFEKRDVKLNIEFHKNAEHLIHAVSLGHNTPGKAVQYDLVDYGEYFIIRAVCDVKTEEIEFDRCTGAVGIDINVDHIALCETDRHGNCVCLKTIEMPLKGKNTNRRKHIIRNVAKEAVRESVRSNKPFVIEKLDFRKKKSMMRYGNKRSNQTLSEFGYTQITEALKSRCQKEKVSIKEVDPAYTSRIAKDKYMRPMGCSIHEAASYVIARRGCGYHDEI